MSNEEMKNLPTITISNAPDVYVKGGLDPYYQQVREMVTSEVNDPTTKAGAERIKSLAAKVSSSKKAVENPGREYLKHLKEMPKVIEAELRDWVQKMDALRDEVRRPVTELEEKEKARIADLDQRLSLMQSISQQLTAIDGYKPTSEVINQWIQTLDQVEIDDSWEEYKDRAQAVKYSGLIDLKKAHESALEIEIKEAEIQRLKAEQAKRDQEERERQIAENARIAAEQKALREKIESEQREAAAKEAAAKALRDAEEAKKRLIREQQESAERERIANEQAQERERLAAIHAAEQERLRIERIEAEKQEEENKRIRDVNHKKKINNEILSSLVGQFDFLSEEQAKQIIKAIHSGKIANVQIKY